MAPLKKLKTLSQTVKEYLIQSFASTFYEIDQQVCQTLSSIFTNNLCPSLCDDLVNMVIDDDSLDPEFKWRFFQAVISEQTIRLKFTFTSRNNYPLIANTIFEKCRNLQELNLYGVWLKDEERLTLSKALKNLPRLKKLVMPQICDDQLLETISTNLKSLRHLDIAGSSSATESGFKHLCKF